MRPFRILAAVLLLIVAAEVWGITHIDTHEDELRDAQLRYEQAVALNKALRQ